MKLISLHINEFGKFKNFDYSFDEQLNEFSEDNGYGKTTIASFIKAMLYGLEKGKKEGSDRHHFAPLTNNNFGGVLTLEDNNDTYKIVRSFSPSSLSKDEVSIEKNGKTISYDKEIGEVLFKIDKETFERLFFINNNDVDFTKDESLKDKLFGTLEQNEESLSKALSLLKEENDNLVKKKTEGVTKKDKIKKEINELEETIKNKKDVRAALSNKIKELNTQKGELEKAEKEYSILSDKNKKISSIKVIKTYQNQIVECTNEINDLKKKYNNKLIEENDLNTLSENLNKLETTKALVENYKISEEKKNRFNTLKDKFKNFDFEGDEKKVLTQQRELLKLDSKILEKKSEEEALNTQSDSKNDGLNVSKTTQKSNIFKIFIVFFLLVFIAGVILCFWNILFIFLVLFGLCGLSISFIFLIKNKSNISVKQDFENNGQNNEEKLKSVQEELADLKTEREDKSDSILKMLNKYGVKDISILDSNPLFLSELSKEFRDFTSVKEDIQDKTSKLKELGKNIENARSNINNILSKYGLSFNDEFSLDNFKKDALDMKSLQSQCESYNKKIEKEKQENNISENDLKEEKELENIDALRENISDLEKKIFHLQDDIDKDDKFTNDLADLEVDEQVKKEELENLLNRSKLLSATYDFLSQAKENITNRYIKPLKDTFIEYSDYFEKEIGQKIILDTDFNLSFENLNGNRLKESQLSSGQKTICAFCLRIALLKNIFKDESKLILILDDPFISLDDNNLSNVKKLIYQISKDDQIIYFTCHNSRQLKK